MAVRFVPVGGTESPGPPERENLAEVIELRTRLLRGAPGGRGPSDRAPYARSAELDSAAPGAAGPHPPHDAALTQASDVREEAVRLLSRRARSSGELRRELERGGHDAGTIEEIIHEFIQSLYLDDLGLARMTMEQLRERKRASRAQIRVKLRTRLLPDEVIEAVLAELDDEDEHDLLRSAARDRARRLDGLDRQVAERRLIGFLARRGWSGEPAFRAVRDALDDVARGDSRANGGFSENRR